jgi:hypothetical protein
MIGSAAPAMKKNIAVPAAWIIRNKLKIARSRGAVCLDRI